MRAERRHEQHVAVREARRGIAGHAEDRLAGDDAEQRRLAGLHGDAVEDDLAASGDGVEDEVALADRTAAREDDQVLVRARVERLVERLERVGRASGAARARRRDPR